MSGQEHPGPRRPPRHPPGLARRHTEERRVETGHVIDGAIDGSLSFDALEPDDAGAYRVVVANTAGSVTSSVATLTVVALLLAYLLVFGVLAGYYATYATGLIRWRRTAGIAAVD